MSGGRVRRVRSRDGEWTVEVIALSATGTGRDGEWLQITQRTVHVAGVRTVAEVAEHVDLSQLYPA